MPKAPAIAQPAASASAEKPKVRFPYPRDIP